VTRLTWDGNGQRYYHTGIDQGVLYVDGQPGVAWNGLTAVTRAPAGGTAKPYYVDGVKYSNNPVPEEYEATIQAYTYPIEFEQCDGSVQVRPGMFLSGQRRKQFGFSYRTLVGNDLSQKDYQINLVYGATAEPTTRGHKAINDVTQVTEFMWKITTMPPAVTGYRNGAHITIDSRYTDPQALLGIEEIIYGTDEASPRLPNYQELLDLYDSGNLLTVTDNGNGTVTYTAPEYALTMLDPDTFQIDWDTAIDNGDGTYTATTGP
jgi:hypothetical protein